VQGVKHLPHAAPPFLMYACRRLSWSMRPPVIMRYREMTVLGD
jgi:hypothetical protein